MLPLPSPLGHRPPEDADLIVHCDGNAIAALAKLFGDREFILTTPEGKTDRHTAHQITSRCLDDYRPLMLRRSPEDIACCFVGGKGSRTGSGLIFVRVASRFRSIAT
jgi:hypothetical protein